MNKETIKLKSLVLLFAELLVVASSAFWPDIEKETYLPIIIYSALLCAGGYLLASSKAWLIGYIAVSAVIFATAFNDNWIAASANIIGITTIYLMLLCQVFKHSFIRAGVQRLDQIIAGVVGYLMLGLFWALQFRWINIFDPTGLKNTLVAGPLSSADQIYFSFVTLTTLGYGEILPVSPFAKMLVMFTTITGTLYLAVFIAGIIGRKSSD